MWVLRREEPTNRSKTAQQAFDLRGCLWFSIAGGRERFLQSALWGEKTGASNGKLDSCTYPYVSILKARSPIELFGSGVFFVCSESQARVRVDTRSESELLGVWILSGLRLKAPGVQK